MAALTRPSHSALSLAVCSLAILATASIGAQTAVTLSPAVTPTAGQAGVTTVALTGSNFPTGTILPTAVTITLEPAAGSSGPTASATATAVITVTGSTRRVTFGIPASLAVTAPTPYRVALAGATSSGVKFVSSGTVSLTVNPPPLISGIAPGEGRAGDILDVTITGQFSTYVQGSTQASFGPGVSVGSGADGNFAAVNVTSPTTATARLTLSATAAPGARTVTVRTGAQQASRADGFVVRPASPPVITISLAPAPNPAGWNSTPVTAHFTCTQDGMPLAGCPADAVIASEGAGQTITRSVTNSAGLTATVTSAPFSIDLTPPSVAVALSPAPNASGIFTAPVTAHFTCADTGSGVAFCPPDQIFSASGTGLIASGSGTDLAGHSTPVTSPPFTIALGGSLPIIEVSLSPSPNAAGWHNTAVTAHFTCTRDGIPLAGCPSDEVIATEGSNQTITRSVTNAAGETASVTSEPFNIDTTPPMLTLSTPTTGTTVFTPSVTLTGLLTDTLSGIQSASCSGAPATVTVRALTCVVSFTPGANTVQATAVDRAGNQVSSSLDFTYLVVPILTITQPANLSYTNISPTTITGTVSDPTATVVVNSVPATVANNAFSVALPLAEGPNLVTATATSASGAAGTATLWLTLDTTPPRVTVTSPADQFVTTDATITVTGIVNDLVVGTVNPEQAAVTVNAVPAQVANRLWVSDGVPLALGANLIQITGRDRVGNQGTTEITVIRVAPGAQPRIRALSGSGQSGAIRSLMPLPLAVELTDASGNPAPGKPVIFKATQNDGQVAAAGPAAPTVIATTDAQGRAEVRWTLGGRAGAGGNVVEAYSVGFEGTAIFTATGTQGPAGKIVVDTGNNQYGPTGQRLPRPLVAVVVDEGNNRLGGVEVTFTVSEGGGSFDGQQNITVVSDPDGRVAATLTLGMQEGESNNVVSATFASNQGFPAGFTASGRVAGDPARTSVSGVVLDNSNVPIPGVTVRAVNTQSLIANANAANAVPTVQTNAQGQFVIPQAPVGFVRLIVDGSTATLPGSYPTLEYDIVTVAGQNMTVGQPIYLLPLNTANSLCVTDTTGGGTLTVPEAPGFSLTFGPGQVTFPGGSKTGCVSVTVVHPDKVPMMPGFGQQPRFIVTIQPAGAAFNPPAPITLPNVDGLAPRSVTEMYSFDHDIGSFVAIGTGTVSEDGQVVRSNVGVGVLKAGWHCGGNPGTSGTAAQCPVCFFCPGALGPCMPQGNGTPCGNGGTCQFGQGCVGGGGECPEGFVRNADGQCCMGDSCTDPECPPGQTLDPVSRSCVNSEPCAPGYRLIGGQCCHNNTCVPPRCPSGQTFDPISEACVNNGPCAPGYTPNSDGQCCQGTTCEPPMCPGQNFDPVTGMCVESPCPPGCSACTTTSGSTRCTVCTDGQAPVNGECSNRCELSVRFDGIVGGQTTPSSPGVATIPIESVGKFTVTLGEYCRSEEIQWAFEPTGNTGAALQCPADVQLRSAATASQLQLDSSASPVSCGTSILMRPSNIGTGQIRASYGSATATASVSVPATVIVRARVTNESVNRVALPTGTISLHLEINGESLPSIPIGTSLNGITYTEVYRLFAVVGAEVKVTEDTFWDELSPKPTRELIEIEEECDVVVPEQAIAFCDIEFDLGDAIPPDISYQLLPTPSHYDSSGRAWLNSADLPGALLVTATFTCLDPDAEPGTTGVFECPSPIGIVLPGDVTDATYQSPPAVDLIGNVRWIDIRVSIDRTPPTFQAASRSIPPNQEGWNREPVEVTFPVTDERSGLSDALSRFEVDGVRFVGTSGSIASEGTHSVRALAVDYAGNISFANEVAVNIDLSLPEVVIRSPLHNQSVSALTVDVEIDATDDISGLSEVLCIVDIGSNQPPATFAAEDHGAGRYVCQNVPIGAANNRIEAVAIDRAGNSRTSAAVNVVNPNPVLP